MTNKTMKNFQQNLSVSNLKSGVNQALRENTMLVLDLLGFHSQNFRQSFS
jgi:hypothetical protein